MAERHIGIIINGATGRIGSTQHLRNLMAIRGDGGLALANGDRLVPEPFLCGRNATHLAALARANGDLRWTTDLDSALASDAAIFMDCSAGGGRPERVRRAIAAGKHIHVEKPLAPTAAEALDLARLANAAGLRHGVIQDKLYLPGFARLLALKRAGFFGRILSLKLESGWWIFDGEQQPCQRPTWSFRTAAGGGMAADMYTHYRYMIDRLAAPVTHIAAMLATHIPSRIDAAGQRYACDADDSAYALLRLEGGAIATIASTWVTRVKRDDLITIQIDGTLGSAVAGGHRCVVQSSVTTPKPTWNTEAPQAMDFNAQWTEVPANEPFRSSFRQTWEAFLRHVAEDAPFVPTLVEGAKAVQLAELAEASHREGRWLEVPPLSL